MRTGPPDKSPWIFPKKGRWVEYRTPILIVVGGLIVMNLIFIAEAFRETGTIEQAAAGQLGDFVGGYIGTLFALVGVVLLFVTLDHQRRASQQQNFETKYFELIKMHRDNVSELDLQDTTGRRIFVLFIRELRLILSVARQLADQHKQQLTQRQLMCVSYYCLFFGTGPNSSRMLKMSLADFDATFVTALDNALNKAEVQRNAQSERKLAYTPFQGHQSRLGHYYRHLYQTVCYVDQREIEVDKYEYVKTIRAQLTTHEQALLLVNSLTPIGQNWWSKGLIVKYRMVQNLPRDFFDSQTELDLSQLFSPGYFEWEEVEEAT